MAKDHDILSSLVKVCLVFLLFIALFILGTMIGYGVLGNHSLTDVFHVSVWQHILDFVKK